LTIQFSSFAPLGSAVQGLVVPCQAIREAIFLAGEKAFSPLVNQWIVE
jgi:hypothetical protein